MSLRLGDRSRTGLAGRIALAGTIATWLSSAAQAQQSILLPAISVVSATLIPTPADQGANTVTVITGEDIERLQRRTVPDLLNTVPGLHVVQNGTPGTQTSVFIRGTNSNHVKVYLDGMDIGDPTSPNGAVDFGHLSTFDLDRVEVLRGPQSGLYGSDAIGGVISLTTKKGDGPAKVRALIEGGSFGTFNQAASLSGSHERFNYSFNVSHFRAADTPVTPPYMVPPGGRAIGNYYDNWTYSTRLGADVNDMLSFNFYGRYTEAKLLYSADDPFAFPGVTLPSQSIYRNQNFYGRGETVVTLFDGRFVNVFGYGHVDYTRTNLDPPATIPSRFEGVRDKFDWRGTVKVMPGHNVVLGLEREDQRARGDNFPGTVKTGNQAGFVELQSELNKTFFFVANFRRDVHDDFGAHNTYRLAPAVIVPGLETKLKASYGTGFKAPTLYQLFGNGPFGFMGNPNLRPEKSRGYDFGFEQPIANNRVRVGATYFDNRIEDLIDFLFVPFTNVNVLKARTHGVEAFATVTVNEQLQLRFDYTHTKAWDLTKNVELRRRPRDKFSATATYAPMEGLTLSSTVLHVSSWSDVDRATFALVRGGPFTTVNLAADYVINKHATVFARADNLFDRRYENPVGWLQPGLAVYGGVRLASN